MWYGKVVMNVNLIWILSVKKDYTQFIAKCTSKTDLRKGLESSLQRSMLVDFEMILVSNLVSRPVRHVTLVLNTSLLLLENAIETILLLIVLVHGKILRLSLELFHLGLWIAFSEGKYGCIVRWFWLWCFSTNIVVVHDVKNRFLFNEIG